MSPLEMERAFYQEYFSDIEGEYSTIEEIIPFRLKSTIKTMNAQYLKKIFKSRKFLKGYEEYLSN